MPKISLIIPVYNTEKFLRRCLDSVLAQTFTDFELILIDDGSTDNSGNICDEYAKKDSRVASIRSNHLGVGGARNLAMQRAKGRYMMFCDSDDYVEPEWMEILYNAATEHPESLVNCEYAVIMPSQGYKEIKTLPGLTKSQIIDKRHYFPLLINNYVMNIWSRIFRTDIIKDNHLKFVENLHQGEDTVFILNYLGYCDSFFYIHQCLYYWAYNDTDTLSRQYYAHNFEDVKTIYSARKPLIADEYLQAFYDFSFSQFMLCTKLVFDARNKESNRKKINYCSCIFKDGAFQETVKNASKASCSSRHKFILRLKSYRLYRLILKIRNAKPPRSS